MSTLDQWTPWGWARGVPFQIRRFALFLGSPRVFQDLGFTYRSCALRVVRSLRTSWRMRSWSKRPSGDPYFRWSTSWGWANRAVAAMPNSHVLAWSDSIWRLPMSMTWTNGLYPISGKAWQEVILLLMIVVIYLTTSLKYPINLLMLVWNFPKLPTFHWCFYGLLHPVKCWGQPDVEVSSGHGDPSANPYLRSLRILPSKGGASEGAQEGGLFFLDDRWKRGSETGPRKVDFYCQLTFE